MVTLNCSLLSTGDEFQLTELTVIVGDSSNLKKDITNQLFERYGVYVWKQPENSLSRRDQCSIFEDRFKSKLELGALVIDTDSDFIINSIRIAVKDGKIDFNDVTFLYLDTVAIPGNITIKPIYLTKEGGFTDYPKGFMDFYDNQLDKLLGWKSDE